MYVDVFLSIIWIASNIYGNSLIRVTEINRLH